MKDKPMGGTTRGQISVADIPLSQPVHRRNAHYPFRMVNQSKTIGVVGLRTGSTYDEPARQKAGTV